MASLQDILGSLAPECQTILDFSALRDDGGAVLMTRALKYVQAIKG